MATVTDFFHSFYHRFAGSLAIVLALCRFIVNEAKTVFSILVESFDMPIYKV